MSMRFAARLRQPLFWRALVQWAFFLWVVGIGVRFALFVRHFESGGAAPFVSRPAGVEGFLPIGALASLKVWLATGAVHPVHPAAPVLLLTILVLALLLRKAFCSWLCPVGTLSEALWKAGRRLFGRNFALWGWLDFPLRGLKYLLLGFFVKVILVDMPARAASGFLAAPYWAVSDVKMLRFFTAPSATALIVLAVLALLSLLYRNFWCRYLCPYGALLGLASLLSPLKVRREAAACTGCGRCARACPSRLPVDRKEAVGSPECTACQTCVESCPAAALRLAPPLLSRPLPAWIWPSLVLGVFLAGVGLAVATGNWQTSLTYEDYRRLIPMAHLFSH